MTRLTQQKLQGAQRLFTDVRKHPKQNPPKRARRVRCRQNVRRTNEDQHRPKDERAIAPKPTATSGEVYAPECLGRKTLAGNSHCFLFNHALLASGDYLILVTGENSADGRIRDVVFSSDPGYTDCVHQRRERPGDRSDAATKRAGVSREEK